MFTDPRELKFETPEQFKRRMRHLAHKALPHFEKIDTRGPEDDRCSCNGTETVECPYCRRQRLHDELPF